MGNAAVVIMNRKGTGIKCLDAHPGNEFEIIFLPHLKSGLSH